MPPATANSDNCPSISFSTSQPTITSIKLNENTLHNEKTITSDTSLSQYDTQSSRSTPASSVSDNRNSPSNEAQSSGLEPAEEIELSTISSHDTPSESLGNDILQSTRDESRHHQTSSSIPNRAQDESDITLQAPSRHRSWVASFQAYLCTVYQYVPRHEITSNTIAIVVLALTAFFGYETYRLAQESIVLTQIATAAQLWQTCNDEKVWDVLDI